MLSSKRGPAVCPNGHAMDDGLFECPACGAYRPSAHNPCDEMAEGAAVRMMLELGIPPAEVAEMTMDARRRRA